MAILGYPSGTGKRERRKDVTRQNTKSCGHTTFHSPENVLEMHIKKEIFVVLD